MGDFILGVLVVIALFTVLLAEDCKNTTQFTIPFIEGTYTCSEVEETKD